MKKFRYAWPLHNAKAGEVSMSSLKMSPKQMMGTKKLQKTIHLAKFWKEKIRGIMLHFFKQIQLFIKQIGLCTAMKC